MTSEPDPQRFLSVLLETTRLFFPSQMPVADTDLVVLYTCGQVLTAMQEPYLGVASEITPWERYRFVWLRTRHNPVAVRAEQQGTIHRLNVRVLNGKSGYDPGTLVRSDERALDHAQWNRLQKHLAAAQYWSLPVRGNRQGFDGAEWVLEGARPGEHRVVFRWSPGSDPEATPFCAVCLYLLDLAALGAIAAPVY